MRMNTEPNGIKNHIQTVRFLTMRRETTTIDDKEVTTQWFLISILLCFADETNFRCKWSPFAATVAFMTKQISIEWYMAVVLRLRFNHTKCLLLIVMKWTNYDTYALLFPSSLAPRLSYSWRSPSIFILFSYSWAYEATLFLLEFLWLFILFNDFAMITQIEDIEC